MVICQAWHYTQSNVGLQQILSHGETSRDNLNQGKAQI